MEKCVDALTTEVKTGGVPLVVEEFEFLYKFTEHPMRLQKL
jgi:hypothetical protein